MTSIHIRKLSGPAVLATLVYCGIAQGQQPTADSHASPSALDTSNTAVGISALLNDTTGGDNSAFGAGVLNANTTGSYNSAVGYASMLNNGTGMQNTALGAFSLNVNSTGTANTACGAYAMGGNTTGNQNSSLGFDALGSNDNGNNNTAAGAMALARGRTGTSNTAVGASALYLNEGDQNTAVGASTLYINTTGRFNTAIGHRALYSTTTGSSNIAVGTDAGTNLTTGSNNIDIGHPGVAGEAGTIRVGANGTHNSFFAAGIVNSKVTGSAVYVTSTGQLGVLASSERYKTSIVPMGDESARLQQLQPVTYRLKTDAHATRQYGLVAEAVAKVYPELVTRNEAGAIEGVRYEELTPMLLNEVQKQQRALASQRAEIEMLRQQFAQLREKVTGSADPVRLQH